MKRQFIAVFCIFLALAAPCWAYYNPRVGRFMQRDPVGAVNPATITPLVNRGAAFVPNHGVPDANREYHDGMNLYQYARSRPTIGTDPGGAEFSVGGLATTMAVQSGVSGLVSGAIAHACGQDFAEAAVGGAIGGLLGGGAGYMVNAFASSMAGLIGTIAAHAVAGALDGGISAFGTTYYNERDYATAFHDALWGAALGAATAGLLDAARPLFRPNIGSLKFSNTVLKRMRERNIHKSVIEDVLENGVLSPDPKGYINKWQYVRQMWINGKERTVKVIWDAAENMIQHVHYE